MQHYPEWSVISCDACKPIEINHNAKPTPSGTVFGIKNPISCPYDFLKVGRKIYARSRHHMEDDLEYFEHTRWGARHKESDEVVMWDDIRCHDCGVPYGYIHHIGCDCEMCPKCGDQLISCECGVKNGQKAIGFLIAVPQLSAQEKKELK